MKILTVSLLLFLWAGTSSAQQLDSTYTITEVVQAPDTDKKELIARAKAWAALAYKNAQYVIQMDDSEAGILVIKGNTSAYRDLRKMGFINHVFTIQAKDGKYKYIFECTQIVTDPVVNGAFSQPSMTYPLPPLPGADKRVIKWYDHVWGSSKPFIKDIILSFKEAMSGKGKLNSDW